MHIKCFDAYSLALVLTQAWPAFSDLGVLDDGAVLLVGLLEPQPATRTPSTSAQALAVPRRLVI